MQVRLLTTIALVALLAAVGPAAAAQKPKANDCSDPYWADTLRCQHTTDGEAPQPNLDDAPATVDDIKAFTRVFLTRDPSVRSVDGTHPVMYVDKAICTTLGGCVDVPRGQPIDSDKWLITVPGGGGCHEEHCVTSYADLGERAEMSTATDAPTKTLNGIHAPVAADNPVFAGYNRIRVEKSSYDRYMGRSSYRTADGLFVHNHGFLIMQEALRALRNGLHYETWADDGSGSVTSVTEKLPALAKAEQVVFVGHSGGSHGLFHNIDHYAAFLESFGGFEGDVRAIFDENFVPGIENESAFDDPFGGDAYSNQWTGTSAVTNGIFDYAGEASFTPGLTTTVIPVQQYDAWSSEMDASCLAAHPAETWKCNERQHVLLNHVETPFLVKEDFSDPNAEHNNRPDGHTVTWADPVVNLTALEFRARVMAQIASLIELSSTRSEQGAGFPTFYAWINDCVTHSGVYEDEVYNGTRIVRDGTAYSLREWAERFVAASRHGASDFRVVGYPGTTMTADCDGVP